MILALVALVINIKNVVWVKRIQSNVGILET
jgi:hypothetical protein